MINIYKKTIDMKFLSSIIKVSVLVGSIFLYGCLGVKNSTKNSGKNLFETFFVGNEGIQYFIKPLTFKDNNKNQLNQLC